MYNLDNLFYSELDLSGGDIGTGDTTFTLTAGVSELSTPSATDPTIMLTWDKAYETAAVALRNGGKAELIEVTSKNDGNSTVTAGTRGFGGTTAQTYSSGDNTTYGVMVAVSEEAFKEFMPLGSNDAHVQSFTGDLDTHLQGIVFADTGHSNSPNGNNGICRAYSLDDNNVVQEFDEIASAKKYYRRKNAGTWQSSPAWSRVGVGVADQWRLTTDFSGDAVPIASNLERVDSSWFSGIGPAMTESSGVFTFPETGIYRIEFNTTFALNGDNRDAAAIIDATLDNSTWSKAASSRSFVQQTQSSGTSANNYVQFIFEVSDVSTHKCRFIIKMVNNSTITRGDTDFNRTYMTFTKLGDT